MSLSQPKYYTYIVHSFTLGDVEDPDIYAAIPISQWESSEAGRWIMQNSAETPSYHIHQDMRSWGYRCDIQAKFAERQAVEYCLRFIQK